MHGKTWLASRSKLLWLLGGGVAAVLIAAVAYGAGLGGGAELNGLAFVTAEDGTVRLRVHGVGVGSTREEVDASPLAAGVVTRGASMSLYRIPGEAGTHLSAMPEFDEDGRVKRLYVEHEGSRLSLRRVASHDRALFERAGGTCDGGRCAVRAGGEGADLAAFLDASEPGTVAITVKR